MLSFKNEKCYCGKPSMNTHNFVIISKKPEAEKKVKTIVDWQRGKTKCFTEIKSDPTENKSNRKAWMTFR